MELRRRSTWQSVRELVIIQIRERCAQWNPAGRGRQQSHICGIEALRHIRQWDHGARILIFTMHSGAGFALKAF